MIKHENGLEVVEARSSREAGGLISPALNFPFMIFIFLKPAQQRHGNHVD